MTGLDEELTNRARSPGDRQDRAAVNGEAER
jgi:hypothetical protein